LGDQRKDGESNYNSGDGTGQMAQPWMFMMMMMTSNVDPDYHFEELNSMELTALNLSLSYFFVSLRHSIYNNVRFVINFHLLLSIIS
jgi:hypothetical protein